MTTAVKIPDPDRRGEERTAFRCDKCLSYQAGFKTMAELHEMECSGTPPSPRSPVTPAKVVEAIGALPDSLDKISDLGSEITEALVDARGPSETSKVVLHVVDGSTIEVTARRIFP